MLDNKGFSLIELSIVLIVMGILIVGVVGGKTLINSSKISSTSSQMNEYATVTNAFVIKYNALPGDFEKAVETFGSTDKNGNQVHDGNGDGFIGNKSYTDQESLNFFQHLNLAGVLENKYTGNLPTEELDILKGDVYPLSKISKGTFYYINSDDLKSKFERTNKLVLYSLMDGASVNDIKLLYAFDKKFDDGKPLTGKIIVATPTDLE